MKVEELIARLQELAQDNPGIEVLSCSEARGTAPIRIEIATLQLFQESYEINYSWNKSRVGELFIALNLGD